MCRSIAERANKTDDELLPMAHIGQVDLSKSMRVRWYQKGYVDGATEQSVISRADTVMETIEWLREHVGCSEELIEGYKRYMEQ